jgi:hypothetical protein
MAKTALFLGSYVKLSSTVVAILVGGLKCRAKLWKGTTQGSSQQSLVEIGSVVEEKIFLTVANQKQELLLVAMFVGQMEPYEDAL